MASAQCGGCGVEFAPRRSWQKFCSNLCAGRARHQKYLQAHGFQKSKKDQKT